MVVALILLLVAVGSVLFHIYSPWWWTPIASNWSYIDHTISITFWITGVVFVAVDRVHGLLRLPLPSQGGKTGGLRSRKQEARNVAHHRHRGRRRRDAGARSVCLAPVRHGSGGRHRDRGHGPAMAMELPPAGQGRPDGHVRCPQHQSRQPDGPESQRSEWAGRRRDRERRPASCRSASRSRSCCAPSTSCTISTCRSFGPRWTWSPAWSPISG